MITRLVPAVLALSLAFPAVAAAQPLPGFPDYPEVDETAAYNYGITHQRELCSIMEYRIAQANPAVHRIDSMITEVAQRGQFNHDSAGFALGVALGSSCPQFVPYFEQETGIDFDDVALEEPAGTGREFV